MPTSVPDWLLVLGSVLLLFGTSAQAAITMSESWAWQFVANELDPDGWSKAIEITKQRTCRFSKLHYEGWHPDAHDCLPWIPDAEYQRIRESTDTSRAWLTLTTGAALTVVGTFPAAVDWPTLCEVIVGLALTIGTFFFGFKLPQDRLERDRQAARDAAASHLSDQKRTSSTVPRFLSRAMAAGRLVITTPLPSLNTRKQKRQ